MTPTRHSGSFPSPVGSPGMTTGVSRRSGIQKTHISYDVRALDSCLRRNDGVLKNYKQENIK